MNTDEQKIAEIRGCAQAGDYADEPTRHITFLLARHDRLQALCRAVVDAGRPWDLSDVEHTIEEQQDAFDALAAELNGGGK